MSNLDLNISEMKKMQLQLFEKHKEKWKDSMEPEVARNKILYMVEEIGECISIIKKKGINEIMNNQNVRGRFVEEFSDVLMYYTEVLNRLDISPEEISNAYIQKHNSNMERDYIKDNKRKYND